MTPPPPLSFLDPVTVDYNDALHFTAMCQDAPFEPPSREDIIIGEALEYSDAAPTSLNFSDFQPTDQAAQNDRYTLIGQTGLQILSPLDPHGSALVANFTLFLEQCGDLFQNLSGRWVTAKHQYSPLSALNRARPQNTDVSPYVQRMRQDGSFQGLSSTGILSIVDTFVQLGYLQTPEDVQDYMIIVGKLGNFARQRICKVLSIGRECPGDGFTLRLQKPLYTAHRRARAKKVLLFHVSETVHEEE
ncbi:hypothetical protein FNYG_01172 [Fusarium nygamai]|uniref:Uncharacterized protein n=1 Tax=Gibberella nygamai TaxID=42673 RepID=A0A2K0WV40_GIBNY|nr:hypothetical protein FNYG_01172 [Fusarium nygamai]